MSDYDRDASRGRAGESQRGMRRMSPVLLPGQVVDYKDAELLRKFVTEQGRLLPSRITGVTAMQQRQIKRAVRQARVMGLLP